MVVILGGMGHAGSVGRRLLIGTGDSFVEKVARSTHRWPRSSSCSSGHRVHPDPAAGLFAQGANL